MVHRVFARFAVALLPMVVVTGAQAASTFTDRGAWESAAGNPVNLDEFNSDAGPGDSFTIASSAIEVVLVVNGAIAGRQASDDPNRGGTYGEAGTITAARPTAARTP